MSDSTMYIDRTKVRELVIECGAMGTLREIDALPISTPDDFTAALVAERDALLVEVADLKKKLTMADGVGALAGIGINAHAAAIQTGQHFLNKLIETEAQRDALRKAAEAVDALWAGDKNTMYGLDPEFEMEAGTPVGKVWVLVRTALAGTAPANRDEPTQDTTGVVPESPSHVEGK